MMQPLQHNKHRENELKNEYFMCLSMPLSRKLRITKFNMAGLLTYSIVSGLPIPVIRDSGKSRETTSSGAYSSGNCSGLTPDSLFIRCAWKALRNHIGGKVRNYYEKIKRGNLKNGV